MRLVRIDWVQEGMELARDIPSPLLGGAPLLRQGVHLTPHIAQRLAERCIRAVWVEDGMGEGIVPAPLMPPQVRAATEEATKRCMDAARSALAGHGTVDDRTLDSLEDVVRRITEALDNCPEAAIAFDDLAGADTYTYTHSIRVATLGLAMGQYMFDRIGWTDWSGKTRWDRRSERMTALGTGLLIHDIGKIVVPAEVLNKPGRLTDEEMELVKTHPLAGVSLLPPDRIDPRALAVIRSHHERWDGSGYPHGKSDVETHEFARLAAVADVYDAVTAERPYKAASAPHVGVRIIREGAGTQFDAQMVEHFNHLVMPYPVGYPVELPGGAMSVVSRVNHDRPDSPTLRYRARSGELVEFVAEMSNGEVTDGYDVDAMPAPVGASVRADRPHADAAAIAAA